MLRELPRELEEECWRLRGATTCATVEVGLGVVMEGMRGVGRNGTTRKPTVVERGREIGTLGNGDPHIGVGGRKGDLCRRGAAREGSPAAPQGEEAAFGAMAAERAWIP